jgi:hypothetical protein
MEELMATPWYQRTLRWGQTNITELDVERYDIDWWREHWKLTKVQGVVVNAGGIVAYYPSKYPLHYRAQFLNDRDLYGEINAAAREEGLTVLARMDSNRATEDFFKQHPEWFTRDIDGNPRMQGDRYTACIFSGYYDTFLVDILKEIIDRYEPDGFTDNSWSGMNHSQICYCENCKQSFFDNHGADIPRAIDWDDENFKKWIRWNYDRRIDIWALNNQITQTYSGNEDCLWLGMISGSPMTESFRFRDMKGILEQSKIIMLDHQHRPAFGFQSNSHSGKLLHGLMGWDKLIPESMPMYQGRTPSFRLSAKPVAEAQTWMVEGFAGTIQPWWHHIGAYHEDRRQYMTAKPLMEWHAENDKYLINRTPIASVGVVWSHENIDYYGKNTPEKTAVWPHEGMVQALIQGRIPYIPVHADHIERDSDKFSVLILAGMGALSDAQCDSVRKFIAQGGSVIATGETSLYDEWGNRRSDFALSDVLGVHSTGTYEGNTEMAAPTWEIYDHHSYLRLHPQQCEIEYGPKIGMALDGNGVRHEILNGFDSADILPFGGRIENVVVEKSIAAPISFISEFPIFPPEFSWMREMDSGKPCVVLNESEHGGRIVYLAADLDRCFRRDNFPDHGNMLINIIKWAANGTIPIEINGPGLVDCQIYEQDNSLIIHLVNLTGTTQEPLHEIIPVGPFEIRIKHKGKVRSLVNQGALNINEKDGWTSFKIDQLGLHDVLVIE